MPHTPLFYPSLGNRQSREKRVAIRCGSA